MGVAACPIKVLQTLDVLLIAINQEARPAVIDEEIGGVAALQLAGAEVDENPGSCPDQRKDIVEYPVLVGLRIHPEADLVNAGERGPDVAQLAVLELEQELGRGGRRHLGGLDRSAEDGGQEPSAKSSQGGC
jgi:hypothetical protein